MAHDEFDEPWEDDPLVRALRAPGSADELAHEREYVAAYRSARPRRGRVRLVGRFGIGATTVVTTIALSAGVAAAYGRVLPDPVQRFAHDVLGPVGVPDPAPERRAAEPRPVVVTATPSTTPAPSPAVPSGRPDQAPTAFPSPTLPTAPVEQPTRPPAAVGSATPPVSEGPTPTPTAPPTPRRVPTTLTAAASDSRVPAGSAVTVAGFLVDQDGRPMRNRAVRLVGRSTGQPWTRVATGRTDAEGRVSLQTAPLDRSTGLRLSTPQGVRSAAVRVVVVPAVTASVARAEGTTTVSVTVRGGQAGDTVVLLRRQGKKLVEVGRAQLDSAGTATFAFPTPDRTRRFVVRIPATSLHASAQAGGVVATAAP